MKNKKSAFSLLVFGLVSMTLTSCSFLDLEGFIDKFGNENSSSEVKKDTYFIYLYDNFNDEFYNVKIENNSTYSLPILDDVDNYSFVGWVDEDGNLFENEGRFDLGKDIDLYAKYEKNYSSINVSFNIDNSYDNLTVWTDFEVNGTIGIEPANISNKDLSNRHSVPLTTTSAFPEIDGSEAKYYCGMYYYAVDKNGVIVYASYGTGSGFGSPRDSYYYSTSSKNVFNAPYWSLHDDWSSLLSNNGPNYDLDGDGILEEYKHHLYDFLIPEGGFVIKGFYSEEYFVKFYQLIHNTNSHPTIASNLMYEYHTKPQELNKWKLTIQNNSLIISLR